MALPYTLDEMIERPHAARGNDRHAYGIRDGARQLEIEAGLGAVAIHGRQQNLSRAQAGHLARIGDRIEAGGRAAAVREDLPSG